MMPSTGCEKVQFEARHAAALVAGFFGDGQRSDLSGSLPCAVRRRRERRAGVSSRLSSSGLTCSVRIHGQATPSVRDSVVLRC